jgi:hypothetical protein
MTNRINNITFIMGNPLIKNKLIIQINNEKEQHND